MNGSLVWGLLPIVGGVRKEANLSGVPDNVLIPETMDIVVERDRIKRGGKL